MTPRILTVAQAAELLQVSTKTLYNWVQFCGHYHMNQVIDERFVIQWEQISRID